MLKVLQYKECHIIGELGWIVKGSPDTFNVGTGTLIAHDLLEHFPHTGNGVADELQALGSIIFIRYNSGMFGGVEENFRNLTNEIQVCLEALVEKSLTLPVSRVKALPGEDGVENLVSRAVKHSAKAEPNFTKALQDQFYQLVLQGYSKATRRYQGDWTKSYDMFITVRDFINTVHAYEGMEVSLNINYTKGTVKFNLTEFDDLSFY